MSHIRPQPTNRPGIVIRAAMNAVSRRTCIAARSTRILHVGFSGGLAYRPIAMRMIRSQGMLNTSGRALSTLYAVWCTGRTRARVKRPIGDLWVRRRRHSARGRLAAGPSEGSPAPGWEDRRSHAMVEGRYRPLWSGAASLGRRPLSGDGRIPA